MMTDNPLVPGRECGECTECCHALSVDAPTLAKPNAMTCPHRCDAGCGIYAARPDVCRDWFCAWRLSATLGEEWRPDRCGILVELLFDAPPAGFSMPGIRFTLLRSASDAFWPPFVDLVSKAIAIRQPAYLCLLGPSGHLPASSFLNVPALEAAASADDAEAVRRCLRRAIECLEAHHGARRSA